MLKIRNSRRFWWQFGLNLHWQSIKQNISWNLSENLPNRWHQLGNLCFFRLIKVKLSNVRLSFNGTRLEDGKGWIPTIRRGDNLRYRLTVISIEWRMSFATLKDLLINWRWQVKNVKFYQSLLYYFIFNKIIKQLWL